MPIDPPKVSTNAQSVPQNPVGVSSKIEMLKISEISPDNNQPRRYFDKQQLEELKGSISVNGIITPILYRVDGDKKIIVSGERRYKAASEIGLEELPAQLVSGDYRVIALTENLQRNSLLPMEEARAIQDIINASGLAQQNVAVQLGKAESTISEILKLNSLPSGIQDAAITSPLWSRNKLLKLSKMKDDKQQAEFKKMLEAIEKKEAAKNSRDSSSGEAGQKPTAQPPNMSQMDRRLNVFKGHIQKLRDRIKKDVEKITDARFREGIEKEIRALLDEVSAYQKGKSEEN
ncbi:ParB/RepB/Spo0J family partition protein [Desulfovibrio desulfuricans]|uniref:ParB/RepB/Spo0J family partition protein n=1 Tax=Desulfovibrio desulfuricans TaxID=876 RepID=UPI0017804809|nr:ParB/RepB/Spo0J family partition protein [Desulfovibrio desulfuricans]MBD8895305.1 ParB/RepB/Spo0J family partition protein [Desulfovibrio desulfuricans]